MSQTNSKYAQAFLFRLFSKCHTWLIMTLLIWYCSFKSFLMYWMWRPATHRIIVAIVSALLDCCMTSCNWPLEMELYSHPNMFNKARLQPNNQWTWLYVYCLLVCIVVVADNRKKRFFFNAGISENKTKKHTILPIVNILYSTVKKSICSLFFFLYLSQLNAPDHQTKLYKGNSSKCKMQFTNRHFIYYGANKI